MMLAWTLALACAVPTGEVALPVLTAPPALAVGPGLAAQLRRQPATVHALARATPAAARAAGAEVLAVLGPVVALKLPAADVPRIARQLGYLERPQPLRPLLDVSRVAISADSADFGDFGAPFRGRGVLIAAYDTGLDLAHPDLRQLGGATRVRQLWNQDLGDTPLGPPLCDGPTLQADRCSSKDLAGHGTHVFAVAASGGPKYRGVAPEAGLVVAQSSRFEQLVPTLAWFDRVAQQESMPLVINLSLGGHAGPHDGTSLECQAIDALPRLVVTAAGNDGTTPVHALARLEKGGSGTAALLFPERTDPSPRGALVEVWGDVGLPLEVQALLLRPDGEVAAEGAFITLGDPGRTEFLRVGTATIAEVDLDAEPGPNPFNGQSHVRVVWSLVPQFDRLVGALVPVVRVRGEGRIDLWVDTPPDEPASIRFDRDRILGRPDQILGDVELGLSDLATCKSAVSVSAYTSRTELRIQERSVTGGGTVGQIASFSAFGPTLSEANTGPKPDLAAPGLLVVAAKSRDAQPTLVQLSPLYTAAAGTSVSAPHVAGAAAVLLSARPDLDKATLKKLLLDHAHKVDDMALDPRWGAGIVDLEASLAALVERPGCTCSPRHRSPAALVMVLWLVVRLSRRRTA